MFVKKPTDEQLALEKVIADTIEELNHVTADSSEFAKITEQLETLNKIRNSQRPDKISPETIAMICANLGGILLVMNFERTHVIATKAFSFISKLK